MKDSDESRLAQRRLMKKSTIIILIGLSIMTGISVYIISQAQSMKDFVASETPVERKTFVNLIIMEQVKKREFKPAGELVNDGKKLGFNLSSNVPVHVALLASVYEKNPEILFIDAKIPPGRNNVLEKAGDRFIYETREGQGYIKFCLVQGVDTAELLKKIARVKNVWLRLPDNQCAKIQVKSR